MNVPRVSVIIPTHNAERFLEASLQSVFAQDLEGFEIIVVDDASTDRTRAILNKYGDRISVILRDTNSGTADIPRYDGIEQANGALCALLDADDLWLPDKLRKQIEFMDKHPEIPLCHNYVMVMNENSENLYVRHEGGIPPTGMIASALVRHCFISTSSVMVRRDKWLAAQRREDITGYGTEWDFFLSIARTHPIGFIPEVLAKYRHSPHSVSRRRWKRSPRDVEAKERILHKGLWRGVIERPEMVNIIVEACHENSEYWRGEAFYDRAAWFALKGLRHRPVSRDAAMDLMKALLKPCISFSKR